MNLRRLTRRLLSLPAVLALLYLGFTSNAFGQNADLIVVKAASSPTVAADTDVQYDISVSNFSGQASTPTNTLTDTLPPNMTFVSAVYPDGWNCVVPSVGGTGTITCTNESPFPDETSVVFSFVFHLASGVSNGTVITNTATISHTGEDPNGANSTDDAQVVVGSPPPPPLTAGDVLISEFRLSGPGGVSDEFIELYCNRDTDCDISFSSLRFYDPDPPPPGPDQEPIAPGDVSITFGQGTVIPARHYLLVGDDVGYTLFTYGLIDYDVHDPTISDFFNDNEGIQLIGASEPTVIDSVGFIGGGNSGQYIEGTGLQPATSARPADQYAYVRKRTLATNGLPQDTNNNASDFVLVSVTGTAHPGITAPPVLGAPGPQGLTSRPSYSNAQVTGSFVEPGVPGADSPNRVREGSGNSGTLSIRRSFTNNTNLAIGQIAFRVIEITTLNSPNILGDQAQLRLVTSGDAETFENSQGRTVFIRGTILEYDVGCGCEPDQPNGGGLNSTVSLSFPPEEEIDPGETVDVQFLLDVYKSGAFRFFIYVEAYEPEGPGLDSRVLATKSVRPNRSTHTPRRFISIKRLPTPILPLGKKPKSGAVIPTKSGFGEPRPLVLPVRVWIIRDPVTTAPAKRQKRKARLKRKASPALRAKADAKNGEPQTQK